jgi:tetratricopeptide (TPR) repeat protein
MIEAACTACGNINRVNEADLPTGAKFVTCASCKSRVGLPSPTLPPDRGPAVPRTMTPGRVTPGPTTSRPATPRSGPIPVRPSSSGVDLDFTPETLYSGGVSDLPAPKGALPPRAAAQPSRTGITDLPAPKNRRTAPLPDPKAASSSSTSLQPISDLPAPKPKLPQQGGTVSRPPPRPLLDLPAPRPRGIGELPPSAIGGLGDLPAPKRTTAVEPAVAVSELLRPEPPRPLGAPEKSGPHRAAPDALAPRPPGAPDALAPRPPGAPDALTPKPPGAPDALAPRPPGAPDALAPRPTGAGLPRHASQRNLAAQRQAVADVPAPRAGAVPDLPGPRPSGIPDLPAPRTSAAPDLPGLRSSAAPDLPAPRKAPADPPATPASAPDLPAPQGFFDDLPRPAAGAPSELPAPKGFFDDLLQPAAGAPPEPPTPKRTSGAHAAAVPAAAPSEPPAPKGFFDDLPGRPLAARPPPAEPPAPKGFFDDLPQPRAAPAEAAPAAPPAPEMAPESETESLQLDLELGNERPSALDLDAPSSGPFDKLDLARRAITPTFGAPLPAAPVATTITTRATPASRKSAPIAAAPAEGRTPTPPPAPAPLPAPAPAPPPARGSTPTRTPTPTRAPAPTRTPTPVRAQPMPLDETAGRARRTRLIRVAVVAALGLGALGAGGLFLYRRHAQEQARRASIEENLAAARSAFVATDPKRWERAAAEAFEVLEADPGHAAAVGLAAEALLADSIGYGVNAVAKAAKARELLAAAVASGRTGPEIDRAQALSWATSKAPDTTRLEQLALAAPADLTLALYLGWGRAARGDAAAAAASFTRALAAEPLRILALLGRASARLALADVPGARADFAAILALDKDHIAAQVGLAAAMPAAQAPQQEAALLAILERKDLAAGDPRAVLQAWVLAAEVARRAGRLGAARDRYSKAQQLAPQDASVMIGLAEIEILDDKLDAAAPLIDQALAAEPGHARAQLAAADLAIRQQRLDEAAGKLQALRARTPRLPSLELARLELLDGKLLEARGQDDAAADAYVEAARLAGDLDLTPALTAVAKLGKLAEAATAARDLERAVAIRQRAERLIAGFAKNAERDPQLALALGMAFLQSGDPARAETWLRRVVAARPNDADARYQLARALARTGREDDAIFELQRASRLAPGRAEIGLELARIYEATHRDGAAGEVYARLLAADPPLLEVLARAGRFYARKGEIAKAGEQGERIHALDPKHPAGLYLQAEGALAAGKIDEAAKLFRAAVESDRDPQYLDGQGRAAEAQAAQTGDAKYLEVALRAYAAAASAAPEVLHPHVGQGRIYVARRDGSKAIPPLLAASKLAPEDPEIARLIGLAYKELSERRVAVEWLARAYRLAPTAETAWHLGQLHTELNATRDALTALTNATRLAMAQEELTGATVPWLTEALYKLGRVYMDAGKERLAKVAWQRYVARNPRPGAQLTEVRRELATTLQRY